MTVANAATPLTDRQIRDLVKMRSTRVTDALKWLVAAGQVRREPDGRYTSPPRS